MKLELSREECNIILQVLEEPFKSEFSKRVESSLKAHLKELKKKETKLLNKQSALKKRLKSIVDIAEKRRKSLIDNQTNGEKIFKAKLKSLNIQYEFQKIVYTESTFYILDFYLPEYQLIIELDGEYHSTLEQKSKDNFRTKMLNALGFKKIKRLSNDRAINISDVEIENIIKLVIK